MYDGGVFNAPDLGGVFDWLNGRFEFALLSVVFELNVEFFELVERQLAVLVLVGAFELLFEEARLVARYVDTDLF